MKEQERNGEDFRASHNKNVKTLSSYVEMILSFYFHVGSRNGKEVKVVRLAIYLLSQKQKEQVPSVVHMASPAISKLYITIISLLSQ